MDRETQTQTHPREIIDRDEVNEILRATFYRTEPSETARRGRPKGSRSRAPRAPKAEHYEVICISMYTKDLDRLYAMVDELKSRGVTKASRSALIRAALDQVDLDKIPRGI